MDEIAQLVEQVKILAETNRAQLERFDQALKMLAELSQTLHQSVEDLNVARDEETTAAEALKDALSDVDAQTDDLAEVTAALVMLRQQEQPESAA